MGSLITKGRLIAATITLLFLLAGFLAGARHGYDLGYVDNGLMVLAPGAFIIIGLFVWLEHTLLNRKG